MSPLKFIILPLLIVLCLLGLVAWTASGPLALSNSVVAPSPDVEHLSNDLNSVVLRIDRHFEKAWTVQHLTPAPPAGDLQVLRRLSLALFGTVPSLEEIRAFEASASQDRLRNWTLRMLADKRFADYFAERLAVAFIGDCANDVPGFRRERFIVWVGQELQKGTPYDELVRRMIGATGQATVYGESNFLMAEMSQGEQYANRLAGRVARAFLGERIDCAQCHDHPFAEWKQADFNGLAAYFGQLRRSDVRVFDDPGERHLVEDPKTLEKRAVEPKVPFSADWLPSDGPPRQQLAAWVTHPENRRFRRAIANRIWGLVFGRPLIAPVDDIPNPPGEEDKDEVELLDLLGDDLASHHWDLRRTVLVITGSWPFRLGSTHSANSSSRVASELAAQWAMFPLVQLRTEQVSRSLLQVRSVRALHLDANVYVHTRDRHRMREFAEQYGELGELELDEQSSSIQQTLVRMTGPFTREVERSRFGSATGRIAAVAGSNAECLDACFLVCLTRRPSRDEVAHFGGQLQSSGRGQRLKVIEDIFWAMLNSPEFVWNH